MKIRMVPILVPLAFVLISLSPAACHREAAENTIPPTVGLSGRILRADGGIPKKADISFRPSAGEHLNTLQIISADSQGTFSADLPKGVAVSVHFTAVDHVETVLPIMLDSDASVEVQLQPNPWKDEIDSVRILGSWNNYSMREESEMTPRDDGSFVWEVKSEEAVIGYQLANITTNGHTVNGTMADSFAYDGGGDYRSILHTTNNRIKIVFSPALLPNYPSGGLPKIHFDKDHGDLEEMASLAIDDSRNTEKFQDAMRNFLTAGGKAEDFHFDTSAWKKELLMAIGHGSSDALREYAAILMAAQNHRFPGFALSEDELAVIRDTAPAASPLWSLKPRAIRSAAGKERAFMNMALKNNPDPMVQREALAAMIEDAVKAKNMRDAQDYYNRFKKDYGTLPGSSSMLAQLNPDKNIKLGKIIPDFSVTLLDGTSLNRDDILGHWTLIDFWATWCGPCVGEMPNLHAAWNRFHLEGFEILSLSLDASREAVEKFRADKWKMPWKNVFLEGKTKTGMTKDFEVVGIPRPILISPEGKIMALEAEVRGPQLIKTIDRMMHPISGDQEN